MNTDKLIQVMDRLGEKDIYSVSLFLLNQLGKSQKYATMSELPYLLDQDDLFKLCKYYGGRTIKIPTLAELQHTMRLILLLQFYKIDGKKWSVAVKEAGLKEKEQKDRDTLQRQLTVLEGLLDEYDFTGQRNYK